LTGLLQISTRTGHDAGIEYMTVKMLEPPRSINRPSVMFVDIIDFFLAAKGCTTQASYVLSDMVKRQRSQSQK
jgi:hypothetical protein